MNFKNKLLFLVICLFFFCSCARKPIVTQKLAVKRIKRCKVAVFPFYNFSKIENLSDVLLQMFTINLAKEGVDVLEPGLVKNFLFRERILSPFYIKTDILKKFGEETKVGIVIGGQIIEASKMGGNVKLSLLIWARDTSTGKFIWCTFYSRTGEDYRKILHFGKISSLNILAQRMIEEVVKDWKERGFFKCEK